MDLDFSTGSIEDNSDEEQLTATEVLERLEKAWINERLAPDLLEPKIEIVECMMEQIREMEENIRKAPKKDVKVSLHRHELDRIQYIVTSYLRCRLEKIERFAPIFLQKERERATTTPDQTPKLTPEELIFAQDVKNNLENHFKTSGLKQFPKNIQDMPLADKIPGPNLDHYVFIRVNRSEEGLVVEEDASEDHESTLDLDVDAQHIIRYSPIAPLVENGGVSLI